MQENVRQFRKIVRQIRLFKKTEYPSVRGLNNKKAAHFRCSNIMKKQIELLGGATHVYNEYLKSQRDMSFKEFIDLVEFCAILDFIAILIEEDAARSNRDLSELVFGIREISNNSLYGFPAATGSKRDTLN